MAVSILHESVPRSETSKAGTVTWMCLPYFVLQKYSGIIANLPPSSHPVRTLLQTSYKLARRERDMQQAVRHLDGCPPESCFHIDQVWCLVLDDGEAEPQFRALRNYSQLIPPAYFITCSRNSISSLAGKTISMSSETTSPDQSKLRRNRPTNLLVYCGNLLWSLPLSDCQTWFVSVHPK